MGISAGTGPSGSLVAVAGTAGFLLLVFLVFLVLLMAPGRRSGGSGRHGTARR